MTLTAVQKAACSRTREEAERSEYCGGPGLPWWLRGYCAGKAGGPGSFPEWGQTSGGGRGMEEGMPSTEEPGVLQSIELYAWTRLRDLACTGYGNLFIIF